MDEKIFIYYDSIASEITQDTSISYEVENDFSILTIVNKNKKYQETYKTPTAIDLFSHFISEEDQNFGLWLSDLLNSNKSKKRFVNYWGGHFS